MKKLLPLLLLSILICCKNENKPKVDYSNSLTKLKDHTINKWDEEQKFIEENFSKYTSCDQVQINYPENKITLTKNNNTHIFNLNEINVRSTTYYPTNPLLGGRSYNPNNIFSPNTEIVGRNKDTYLSFFVNYSGLFSENSNEKLIYKKYNEWMKNETSKNYTKWSNSQSGMMYPGSKNPSDPEFITDPNKNPFLTKINSIKRNMFTSLVSDNKNKYNRMTVIDYTDHSTYKSKLNNSEEVFHPIGTNDNLFVQLSFKETLIKFEIYDNLEYDVKYDENSFKIINECLINLFVLNRMKESEKKELEKKELEKLKESKKIN